MARSILTIDDHLAKIDFGKTKDPLKCWLWTGGLNEYGFPVFGFEGKTRQAHRVMWEKTNGVSATGLVLKHSCKVNACCNPDHLFIQRKHHGNYRSKV